MGQCFCPSGKREVNSTCVDCALSQCGECDTSPSTGLEVCTNCTGYYLLDGDTCTTCNIIGCLVCENTTHCKECNDGNATLSNGQCQCNGYYEKPSSDGSCQNCYVPGCSSCQKVTGCMYSSDCVICSDARAYIQDGSCYCPTGLYMSGDGHCTTCKVIGCKTCSNHSDEVCVDCIDKEYAVIDNGACRCKYNKKSYKDWFMPNFFGECGNCNVDGCASCTLNSSICYQCTDEDASLIDGICVCPDDEPMNS